MAQSGCFQQCASSIEHPIQRTWLVRETSQPVLLKTTGPIVARHSWRHPFALKVQSEFTPPCFGNCSIKILSMERSGSSDTRWAVFYTQEHFDLISRQSTVYLSASRGIGKDLKHKRIAVCSGDAFLRFWASVESVQQQDADTLALRDSPWNSQIFCNFGKDCIASRATCCVRMLRVSTIKASWRQTAGPRAQGRPCVEWVQGAWSAEVAPVEEKKFWVALILQTQSFLSISQLSILEVWNQVLQDVLQKRKIQTWEPISAGRCFKMEIGSSKMVLVPDVPSVGIWNTKKTREGVGRRMVRERVN